LRREFDVHGTVHSATLKASALGVYELLVNGGLVGSEVLAPGWTSYGNRLLYQTFDLTSSLREGRNALAAMLGDGWYRGRLGFHGGLTNIYGSRLALIAQLEIEYDDGSTEIVVTDEGWCASTGAIRSSSLYDGETYDARLEQPGWADAGFDDGAWSAVRVLEHDLAVLSEPPGPPVRRIEQLEPVAIGTSPSGRTICDFGQNIVGRLRVTVNGEAGHTVTLRHAEVLEEGELCMRPLRDASATDHYTLAGHGVETWEPRFTFHGFRYAELDNWPSAVRFEDVRALVLHTDMERTGWFECSDPLLERLHENALWSMRGNFFAIPTDCPQRDERLGWTGDIQIFAPAAAFLYDVDGFLRSWLADLAAEQTPAGSVPHVVPDILPLLDVNVFKSGGAAAWGDAAVIVPWVLYERYGDASVLADQYDSMRGWVDYVAGRAGDDRLWRGDFQFGDWLDPTAPHDEPGRAQTDASLVATAYFARSARLLAQTAAVLGCDGDALLYAALADDVAEAFRQAYVEPSGRLSSDSQTAYCLALEFDLLAGEGSRRLAAHRLVELVRENGHRIGTGFVGTPLVCDALANNGHLEDAYKLLLQRECPSWLYPVTMGATTIWERWDSMLPDGSVNPGDMTSFNHYALGAVVDWLHRTVAGLAPAEPGYRRQLIRPRPGGGLTYANAQHLTPYGLAEAGWRIEDGELEVRAVVPPGTSATVVLPGVADAIDVEAGTHSWVVATPSLQRV
jgi:alpha-L-rhamnosidase